MDRLEKFEFFVEKTRILCYNIDEIARLFQYELRNINILIFLKINLYLSCVKEVMTTREMLVH